uniref:IMD domain-containing protein n=1 Tax=Electrophorus electricus TaxID=8005 RepID=A0A4W4HRC2_ELEEL
MSRSDELNKMTENVYKGILDQFNPSLKNFVTMGKHYEKALTGVTVAAKGYFDALVKLGELASDSQGSKELGDTLFQMAEVHRQIQVQLEDVLKLFHSELLSQLEQKLDLDIKYLTVSQKFRFFFYFLHFLTYFIPLFYKDSSTEVHIVNNLTFNRPSIDKKFIMEGFFQS